MSQQMAVFNPAGMPANVASLFGGMVAVDDLTSGAEAAFPILSIKGRVFRVKHGGEERVLQRDGQPLFSLDVVLLKANPQLSKLYYNKAYAEGDDAAPDCSSANGVAPDSGVPNPQSATCATCPQNVWGSKITPQGTKTKACADMRRLAIVPEKDIACQTWGAPLLLRVPAASLRGLSEYGRTQLGGKPYTAVVTRISFDLNVAYPKLTFTPIRWLDAAEAQAVLAWMTDPIVGRIIGTDVDPSAPNAQVTVASTVVQAPPTITTPAVTVAPDLFAPSTSVAPVNVRTVLPLAPAVVQPLVDPLAGIPEAMRPAVMAAGGPESPVGKLVIQGILAAQHAAQPVVQPAKRTRRAKAEMDAVRAVIPGAQGHVLPNTGAGQVSERAAPPPTPVPSSVVAPTGQDDLLAGVDALLAGLDNMQFDD